MADLRNALDRLAARFPGAERSAPAKPAPAQPVRIHRPKPEPRDAHDFVITIHALERMVERHPVDTAGMSDREIGKLVHREVMDALGAGYFSKISPAEFVRWDQRWEPSGPDQYVVWTKDKKRAYPISYNNGQLLVMTVLRSRP